tara:strand:+ start:2652 stop:3377 length:726 start_codon:yes stop_codon:yes gene_type:complete
LEKLKIYLRISEKKQNKNKPDYINNENCLNNFLRNFMGLKDVDSCVDTNNELNIIADNVGDETYEWLVNKKLNVERTSTDFKAGSGADSFRYVLNKALELDDDTIVYFVEDDYLHLPNSRNVLMEGIKLGADYVTLYDHPDKFVDGINPYVSDGGEETKVFLTKSSHWKLTNSTTMTFASKASTLKKDKDVFDKWTIDFPNDFEMFIDLRKKGKSLISPIPGYSTHGESKFLSPLTNWEEV